MISSFEEYAALIEKDKIQPQDIPQYLRDKVQEKLLERWFDRQKKESETIKK